MSSLLFVKITNNEAMSFRIGAYILLLTCVSHLVGHFIMLPHFHLTNNFTGLIPQNKEEELLLKMMNDYHKEIGGSSMSMMDLQDGLSLCYALFFGWSGTIALLIANTRELIFKKRISIVYSITLFIGMIISSVYFFWLPVVSFGSAMMCFAYFALKSKTVSQNT